MCATRASRDSISVVAGAAVLPALVVSEAAAERWGFALALAFAALRLGGVSGFGLRLRCGDLPAWPWVVWVKGFRGIQDVDWPRDLIRAVDKLT